MVKNILIMEDEGLIALELKTKLKSWGYDNVFISSTGSEALEIAKNHPPHLVVADIHLKGKINGIETIKKLKEFTNFPVIIISAYINQNVVDSALEINPNCYLIKPLNNEELRINIQLALK
ncbi:hypothetical protein JCM15415_17830 [Methanobacterium movens]